MKHLLSLLLLLNVHESRRRKKLVQWHIYKHNIVTLFVRKFECGSNGEELVLRWNGGSSPSHVGKVLSWNPRLQLWSHYSSAEKILTGNTGTRSSLNNTIIWLWVPMTRFFLALFSNQLLDMPVWWGVLLAVDIMAHILTADELVCPFWCDSVARAMVEHSILLCSFVFQNPLKRALVGLGLEKKTLCGVRGSVFRKWLGWSGLW